MSENTDLTKYMADVSATIVNEIFEIVSKEAQAHGDVFAEGLSTSLIRNLIYVLILNSLLNPKTVEGSTKEQIEDSVRRSYAKVKSEIQNAVADGFESASAKYSGENLGYYCKVMTAGQPSNKIPH